MSFLKNAKLKSMLLITSIGMLAVVSCFSLTAFAQSSIEKNQEIVFTEAVLSKEIDIGKIADFENKSLTVSSEGVKLNPFPEAFRPVGELTVSSGSIKLPVKMNSEQAAPFIQAATEALGKMNITLLPEKYIIEGSYSSESGSVRINFLPEDWKDLSPMDSVSGNAYFVSFENVDINAGTGNIAYVHTVDGISISKEYNNMQTLRFKNLQ